MTIYLVRHGETALNAARVVQPAETPLSERGRAQAACLARRLAAEPIAAIRSSDLPRALETAEAVRRLTGAPVEVAPDLQERNFGDLRGTAYADLTEDIFAPDYVPPDGESWDAFHARVVAAWDGVIASAARLPRGLVVVTHGLVCRAVLDRILGDPAPARIGNTALTIVDGPPWHARLIGCTEHLDPDVRGDGERA